MRLVGLCVHLCVCVCARTDYSQLYDIDYRNDGKVWEDGPKRWNWYRLSADITSGEIWNDTEYRDIKIHSRASSARISVVCIRSFYSKAVIVKDLFGSNYFQQVYLMLFINDELCLMSLNNIKSKNEQDVHLHSDDNFKMLPYYISYNYSVVNGC